MVSSITKSPAPSRDRLLSAAAAEFAARGFDGATVDRIAARARVNKAMIYYHFRSKAGLYREILLGLFAEVAASTEAVRSAGGTPDRQLRGFVEAIASGAVTRPHFPPIWLREMAEAGRHVDRAIVAEIGRVLAVLAAILRDGHREGIFRPANPLVIQMGIVAPLLMFAASGPVRAMVADQVAMKGAATTPDAIVRHVQDTTLAGLARRTSSQGRQTASRRSKS